MANLEMLLEAERRGILPANKVGLLVEARRRGMTPGSEPETVGGGAQMSFPTPTKDVPIVPEGPVPELRAAPSQAAINVHNVAHETLPPLGGAGGALAAGGAAVPTGPGALVAAAFGGGVGFAAGRKTAEAVDAATGFPSLHPPRSGKEAALRTVGDVITGAQLETGGLLAGGAIGATGAAGLRYLQRSELPSRGANKNTIADAVARGFKAVRRTVKGSKTFRQRASKNARAQDAVLAVAENKHLLRYTDDAGSVVGEGRVPENMREFSEAIDQLKRATFQQYDDLAAAAGARGAKVDTAAVADDLGKLLADAPFTNHAPGAAKYARQQMETLRNQGSYTAKEAQDAIQYLNSKTRGFHSQPSPDQAGVPYVQERIAGHLRVLLDDAVTAGSGPGYQRLKNQYGALRSIEDEVGHRVVVFDRQNPRSLFDFASDAMALHAVFDLSPLGLIKAGAAKGLGIGTKRLNDPNRQIAAMFQRVEKELSRGAKPTALRSWAERTSTTQ